MDRWVGKVAVVTGASDGIGASIVKELLNNGIIVVGMARRKEKIQELSTSQNLHSLQVDLRNEDEIERAFEWVNKNVGLIHILINSVGTAWVTSLINVEAKLWKDQFDTDFYGFLLPTGKVVRQMVTNNIDGHIVHIGGLSGHNVTIPNFPAVGANKSAITATTESLRQELLATGNKTKISLISPGVVKTEIVTRNANEQKSLLECAKALEKFIALESSDLTDAVMYVLSTPPHVQVHNIQIRAVGSPI